MSTSERAEREKPAHRSGNLLAGLSLNAPETEQDTQLRDPIYLTQGHEPVGTPQPLDEEAIRELDTPDKLTEAIKLSVNKVDDKFVESLQAFVQPETLTIIGGVLSVWGAAHLVGIGQAADAALLGAGTLALGADIGLAVSLLWNYFDQAQQAQTPEQLEQSADSFAEFVNLVGVNVLGVLVGAKLGKVTDDLAQVMKNNWGKVAELGANVQQSAGALLKSGRQVLGEFAPHLDDALTDGQRLFNQGLDQLDNLVTQAGDKIGIRSPWVVTEGGPLNTLSMRIEKSPGSGGGIAANGAETIAAQAQRLERQLVSRGVFAKSAHKATKLATGQPKVLQAIDGLLNGQGNLENPQELVELVKRATSGGESGILRELEIAATRVRKGHNVQLGTIHKKGVGNVGADIVDHTTEEAIHSKNMLSPNLQNVEEELLNSAAQFKGKRSKPEIVPTTADGKLYHRATELIINNPKNPLYDQSPNQLTNFLEQQFKDRKLQENIDSVRITNQKGMHEFRVIRSDRTGRFQFISPGKIEQPRQVS
ncbi:MAG: hypothetical protein ACFCU8_17205 [Thermosynechococcaceae cyanobacterium]